MYIYSSMSCMVTVGPSPLNSSWDLVGAGCCQGLRREEEGEGRSRSGSFVERLKEKRKPALVNCMLKHSLQLSSLYHLYGLEVSIPFCFNLKFCHDNIAVTTPNTVMVTTHSATKEVVVAMKTTEEGEGCIIKNRSFVIN